jgi:CHRD domain-containing protein
MVQTRRVGAAALAAVGLLVVVFVRPAAAVTVTSAYLDGASVVGSQGDPAAHAYLQLSFDLDHAQVCTNWTLTLEGPTFAEIHEGAEGATGPLAVSLPEGGCAQGDATVLAAIQGDPGSYYVQVASATYPDGAIRGQLRIEDIALLEVVHHACPASIQSPADADFDFCPVAVGSADLPATVDGKNYDPEPTLFDVDLLMRDPTGTTLADPQSQAFANCDGISCVLVGASYRFSDAQRPPYVLAGPTTIEANSTSDGYRLGTALVFDADLSEVGGSYVDAAVNLEAKTVAFDSTGGVHIIVRLLYFAATAEGPTSTVPPTSTLAAAADSGGGWWLAISTSLIATLAAALAARRPDRRSN